jgi:hypothetical protein
MLRSTIVVFGERKDPFTKYDNCWSKHNVFMIIWVGFRHYDETFIGYVDNSLLEVKKTNFWISPTFLF